MFARIYFTSVSDPSSGSGVLPVDVAADVVGGGSGVIVGIVVGGVGIATRRSGTEAVTGWADWVVVLSAGAKAAFSMASRSKGKIPVLRKAL
jgi:hypothetical protein